ncbi:MAG TPA: glycosyltransferase family A protein, partial [Actinophytocola sp.]
GRTLAARLVQQVAAARRRATPSWRAAARPVADPVDVDVLLVRRPGEVDPDPLVDDLLTGTARPRRILVGEDGVRPAPARPYDLLWHEAPLGRGLTRNTLLTRSTAEWLLILDGGMRASRFLIERFLAAADGVDVVHCPVADPVEGLVGALPAEERRLGTIPYLGSGYLIRRRLIDALGGWTEDPLLDGLEDHLLWRRIAAADHPSALVQQILIRRTRPDPAPRPVDLDPHRVWAQVVSHL